jgi:hypothetical protein
MKVRAGAGGSPWPGPVTTDPFGSAGWSLLLLKNQASAVAGTLDADAPGEGLAVGGGVAEEDL